MGASETFFLLLMAAPSLLIGIGLPIFVIVLLLRITKRLDQIAARLDALGGGAPRSGGTPFLDRGEDLGPSRRI